MTIYAIDPGPVKSAIVILREDGSVNAGTWPNQNILEVLDRAPVFSGVLVVEMIASYGMAVGAEVFETCVWVGRYLQRWLDHTGVEASRLTRIQVKSALCHSAKAKDTNVRQALIDRFGGPSCIRKGGPLYKVHGDEWAALAVAVTFREQQETLAAVRR